MPVFSNTRQNGDVSGLKEGWGEMEKYREGQTLKEKKSIFSKRERKNQTFQHYEDTAPPLSLLLLSSN